MDAKSPRGGIGTKHKERIQATVRDWKRLTLIVFLILFTSCLITISFGYPQLAAKPKGGLSRRERRDLKERCANLNVLPQGFKAHPRTESDRFVHGTNATLIVNARVCQSL